MNALMNLNDYPLAGFYDELIDSDHRPRPAARQLFAYLSRFTPAELHERRAAVDAAIMTMGITFTIYSDGSNIDRSWPFDIIPRAMAASEIPLSAAFSLSTWKTVFGWRSSTYQSTSTTPGVAR